MQISLDCACWWQIKKKNINMDAARATAHIHFIPNKMVHQRLIYIHSNPLSFTESDIQMPCHIEMNIAFPSYNPRNLFADPSPPAWACPQQNTNPPQLPNTHFLTPHTASSSLSNIYAVAGLPHSPRGQEGFGAGVADCRAWAHAKRWWMA